MERAGIVPVFCAALLLSACVAPQLKPPKVSRVDISGEALKQKELAAENYFEQFDRLYRVSEPVSFAGAPYCGEWVRPAIGFSGFSIAMIPRDFQPYAVRKLRIGPGLKVLQVMHSSPAHEAGMRPGDQIVSIGGARLVGTGGRADPIWTRVSAKLVAGQPVEVLVSRAGIRRTLEVTPQLKCAFETVLTKSDVVNAYADGYRIFVTRGMMDFAERDQHLAMMFSHELAHNAMRHRDAKEQNAVAGALFGALFDIAVAAFGVNTGGAFSKLGRQAGGRAFSPDFEREADYIGLYMMSAAGWRLDGAADFWRKMATRSPGSIEHSTTHPPTAERAIAIEAAATEIEIKKRTGLALVPEGIELGGEADAPHFVDYVGPAGQVAGSDTQSATTLAALVEPASAPAGQAWRAAGAADACGKAWDIELTLAGDKAEGSMTRDGVLYDLVGWLDSRAQRLEVRGGKSRSASHRPGPRIMEFALGEEAGGWRGSFYAAAAGSRQCLTEVHLTAQ